MKILTFMVSLVTLCTFASASENKTIPKRVISCTVAGDEILLQLLPIPEKRKRILALSTLADDTRYSNIHQEARQIPLRVGANVEQVLSLKPDLVIAASYNQPDFLAALRKLKIKVHIMEGFQSLSDLKRHIQDLGKLVGEDSQALTILKKMEKEISDFKNPSTSLGMTGASLGMTGASLGMTGASLGMTGGPKKILPMLPDRTLIGKETLLDDLLTSIGYTNLAGDLGVKGWQKISEEKLLQLSPDFILTSGEEKERKDILFTLNQSPALKKMLAKNTRIVLVPSSIISSFSPTFLQTLHFLKSSHF